MSQAIMMMIIIIIIDACN